MASALDGVLSIVGEIVNHRCGLGTPGAMLGRMFGRVQRQNDPRKTELAPELADKPDQLRRAG